MFWERINADNIMWLFYPSEYREKREADGGLDVVHSVVTRRSLCVTPLVGKVAESDEVQQSPECCLKYKKNVLNILSISKIFILRDSIFLKSQSI